MNGYLYIWVSSFCSVGIFFLFRTSLSLLGKRCFVKKRVFRFREGDASEGNRSWRKYWRRALEPNVPSGIIDIIAAVKTDQRQQFQELYKIS